MERTETGEPQEVPSPVSPLSRGRTPLRPLLGSLPFLGLGSRGSCRLAWGVESRDESLHYERLQTGGRASISSPCANSHPLSADRQTRWQGTCGWELPPQAPPAPMSIWTLRKNFLLTHILEPLGSLPGVPGMLSAPCEDSRGSWRGVRGVGQRRRPLAES